MCKVYAVVAFQAKNSKVEVWNIFEDKEQAEYQVRELEKPLSFLSTDEKIELTIQEVIYVRSNSQGR